MTSLLRFVALSLLIQSTALFAAADKSGEADVRRIDGARVKAVLAADVDSLERLFADNMVYVHSNGRIDTKSGYLATLRSGALVYVSLQYDPAPQILVEGSTAVATGRATIEVKSKTGQVTKRVLTTTTVYARSGNTWKVVSYQATPAT